MILTIVVAFIFALIFYQPKGGESMSIMLLIGVIICLGASIMPETPLLGILIIFGIVVLLLLISLNGANNSNNVNQSRKNNNNYYTSGGIPYRNRKQLRNFIRRR